MADIFESRSGAEFESRDGAEFEERPIALLESKIYSLLIADTTIAAKLSQRVYPLIMPQNPTLPAVTYQRIASQPVYSLSGYANLDNAKILINSWGTGYEVVKELAADVHSAMDRAGSFKAILTNDLDGYDEDVKLYVVSQNYSCWDRTT